MSANAPVAVLPNTYAPRIRRRILLLFGVFLVVLLAVMVVMVLSLLSTNEAEQWQGRQSEASSSSIFRVESFITDARERLISLAEFSDVAQHPDSLIETIRNNPQFLELLQLDGQGEILDSQFQDAPLLANQVARPQANWFARSLGQEEGQIYLSPIQLSVDNQPYIVMSAPAQMGGVIGARISLTVFSEVISQLTFGETGQAYVVSSDGFVLAHTDPQVVADNTNITGRPEFERALFRPIDTSVDQSLEESPTEAYDNFRGVPVVGTSERIPGLDWVIFTEVDQAEVFKATTTALTTLIIVMIIVFLVTMLVSSEGQRRLLFKPLADLRANVDKVSQGNSEGLYQATSRDEIGEVIQSFNDMVLIVNQRAIERDRLIRDLQAAKRLAEENSRLKSEFLSTMSHELRTPMNAIEGFVGIILSRMGGTDYNDKTSTYLQRVRANSQRLLALINDFLDLSRVESGRLDLASQPFDPVKLAQRWRSELGILAENKHIGFDLTVDPNLPKSLIGDEEAISKVIINLIGNAIKFTEKGKVTLKLEAAGNDWNIVVTDTGIGIPPHAREFVFEEFRQVDQTSKRKYGGTGLGLAIVQKYTRSMGGQVTLKSELGQGSEFTVTLPIVTVQQMKKAKEA